MVDFIMDFMGFFCYFHNKSTSLSRHSTGSSPSSHFCHSCRRFIPTVVHLLRRLTS